MTYQLRQKKHQCITKQHCDNFSNMQVFQKLSHSYTELFCILGSTVLDALHRTKYRQNAV